MSLHLHFNDHNDKQTVSAKLNKTKGHPLMSVILVQESPSDGGPTCISWRVATIL